MIPYSKIAVDTYRTTAIPFLNSVWMLEAAGLSEHSLR